jgi:DNA-binding IclR family transcriptional regulator
LAELESVRRQGFAIIKDELEEGLVAVAAPVRENDGTVVGAISISGPAPRFTDKQLASLGELIIAEIASVKPEDQLIAPGKVGAA